MNDGFIRILRTKKAVGAFAFMGFFALIIPVKTLATPVKGYVMQVQLTPAVCTLDASKKKTRRCLEGYSLTINGLLPETNSKNCSTNSSAILSPLQAKVVARVMPEDTARMQLWRSVGGCIPKNASQYFRSIINLAERLKIPADITSMETKVIQNAQLRSQFLKLNPSLPSNGIRFTCQNSATETFLTEIQVCYKVNGQYKQCSNHVVSNCPATFSIKGTY